MLHTIFSGIIYDWSFAEADISYDSSDAQVKQALSFLLSVPVAKFDTWYIDREVMDNLTARPSAVFGNTK